MKRSKNFTSKDLNNKKLLKKLLEKIDNLESKLDAKAHLTYSNTIWQFIDSDFLTAYSPLKLLILYYLKKFLDLSFRNTFLDANHVYKFLSNNYYLGWIIFTIYSFYILNKYLKSKKGIKLNV